MNPIDLPLPLLIFLAHQFVLHRTHHSLDGWIFFRRVIGSRNADVAFQERQRFDHWAMALIIGTKLQHIQQSGHHPPVVIAIGGTHPQIHPIVIVRFWFLMHEGEAFLPTGLSVRFVKIALTGQLLLQGLPGYAPEGYRAVEAKLTLPAFEQQFRTWLLEDYHQRIHSEMKCIPHQRWEARGFCLACLTHKRNSTCCS
jgi:hypothetical protein